VKLVKRSPFSPVTEEELIDPRQAHIYDCLHRFAEEYKIPILVPPNDAEVDFAGLRIIRNCDRDDKPCCGHPERGICDGGESTERVYDPVKDEPKEVCF
jgi:hypothetical protein